MNKSITALEDEILVLRSQQGQNDAFEELVGRWQKRLWLRAFRVTKNETASWDIVQNTWQRVVRSLSRLENPAAFPGWILRITNNLAVDWIRREIRQRSAQESYVESAHDINTPRNSSPDLIRQALARLKPDDCEVLTLFYLDELGLSDIAAILGIPEGTAKSRLHYARTRLKTLLEEHQ